MSAAVADVADQQAVIDAMHAERAEKNTRNVDCWACEAAKSETVAILLDRLRETQAELARSQSMLIDAEAVFDLAVPDNDQQRALWRVILQRKLTDASPNTDGGADAPDGEAMTAADSSNVRPANPTREECVIFGCTKPQATFGACQAHLDESIAEEDRRSTEAAARIAELEAEVERMRNEASEGKDTTRHGTCEARKEK